MACVGPLNHQNLQGSRRLLLYRSGCFSQLSDNNTVRCQVWTPLSQPSPAAQTCSANWVQRHSTLGIELYGRQIRLPRLCEPYFVFVKICRISPASSLDSNAKIVKTKAILQHATKSKPFLFGPRRVHVGLCMSGLVLRILASPSARTTSNNINTFLDIQNGASSTANRQIFCTCQLTLSGGTLIRCLGYLSLLSALT